MEIKRRTELEEQERWLQLELEKVRRALEAETRARNALKIKLENEMKEWKTRLEDEIEGGMYHVTNLTLALLTTCVF